MVIRSQIMWTMEASAGNSFSHVQVARASIMYGSIRIKYLYMISRTLKLWLPGANWLRSENAMMLLHCQ